MTVRLGFIAAALAVLAGCGVDGPPTAPAVTAAPRTPGVTVSGDARVGVVANL